MVFVKLECTTIPFITTNLAKKICSEILLVFLSLDALICMPIRQKHINVCEIEHLAKKYWTKRATILNSFGKDFYFRPSVKVAAGAEGGMQSHK